MKKLISIVISMLISLVLLTGCSCEHEWVDANCDTAKTCSLCNATEGEPLGHAWQEASCAAPKTCSACGMTEGAADPHIFGKWSTLDFSSMERSCDFCGFVENGSFEDGRAMLEDILYNTVWEVNIISDGSNIVDPKEVNMSGSLIFDDSQNVTLNMLDGNSYPCSWFLDYCNTKPGSGDLEYTLSLVDYSSGISTTLAYYANVKDSSEPFILQYLGSGLAAMYVLQAE